MIEKCNWVKIVIKFIEFSPLKMTPVHHVTLSYFWYKLIVKTINMTRICNNMYRYTILCGRKKLELLLIRYNIWPIK